jgi:hypothetical protein
MVGGCHDGFRINARQCGEDLIEEVVPHYGGDRSTGCHFVVSFTMAFAEGRPQAHEAPPGGPVVYAILIRNGLGRARWWCVSDLVGDARAWSPDVQEAVRLLVVSALVEGRDRVEVAALFKVSARAVENWWARWRAGGRNALLSRTRGRRVGGRQVLPEAEQAAVRQAVLNRIPSDPGLSGQLSTRQGGR